MAPSRSAIEKRSRSGCQTCKDRRKKCPEDFVDRKGEVGISCSTCFKKRLSCGPPTSVILQEPLSSVTSYREPVAASEQRPIIRTAPYTQTQALQSSGPTKDSTFDSSWLDNFFKEFSSLSDPIYQDAVWLANGATAAAPPVRASLPSVNVSGNGQANALIAPDADEAPPSHDRDYQRIVQSHELDSLLERYSALYEQLWRAVITSPTRDEELTRGILNLSRSSKACRAAAVAICLSYHHIMQRERLSERPHASFGLAHFLLAAKVGGGDGGVDKGGVGVGDVAGVETVGGDVGGVPAASKTSGRACSAAATQTGRTIDWPSTEEDAGLAYKWYHFAVEEYRRTGHAGTLEQRLSTLLNLRWTIIALDGCLAGRAFMDEIRTLISQIGVTTGYMRHTVRQGTLLSLIVQSVLAADIFDAAATTGQRCAIFDSERRDDSTPSSNPRTDTSSSSPLTDAALSSRVLTRDLQSNMLFDYEFTSCLSVQVIECILRTANLAVDLSQGTLTGDTATRQKLELLETIRNCQFKKTNMLGTAGVRAMALHEIWRQSTLIYYHQAIQKLGPLATEMQDALQQILELVDMLSTTLHASEAWDMWMVWFLAGSVAVRADHRAKCLRLLEGLGSERALLDNIKVLRAVWQATDRTGHTQSWSAIAAEQGIAVCYGF